MSKHKNNSRAALRPLDAKTLALSVGGLGFLRPAPGTWGSLPPVVLAIAMAELGRGRQEIIWTLLATLLLSSLACVMFGSYAEQRFGRKDAAEVVADETAGVCIPLLVILLVVAQLNWGCVVAFVLFRLFDIAKPWPMGWLENLPAGWGVLLDDLMAGVYAALLIMATVAVWPALVA